MDVRPRLAPHVLRRTVEEVDAHDAGARADEAVEPPDGTTDVVGSDGLRVAPVHHDTLLPALMVGVAGPGRTVRPGPSHLDGPPHLGPDGLGLRQRRRRGAVGALVEGQLLRHGGALERGGREAGAADGGLARQDGGHAPVPLLVGGAEAGQLLTDGGRRHHALLTRLDHHGGPLRAVRGVRREGAHLALAGRVVLPGRHVDEAQGRLRLLTTGRTASQEARVVVGVRLGRRHVATRGRPLRLGPRGTGLRRGLRHRTGRERGSGTTHGLRHGRRLGLRHGRLGRHHGVLTDAVDRHGLRQRRLGGRLTDHALHHADQVLKALAHLGDVGLELGDADGVVAAHVVLRFRPTWASSAAVVYGGTG